MNQRSARTHRAAMPADGNINIKRLIDFANESARLLLEAGEDDASFYFEQLAEHLQKHPEKGLNESVSRILGL